MSVEYDSDDFDMEQIAGVDNPEESDSDHDEGINAAIRRNIVSVTPKKYKVHTRVKVMDKKTHKRVYKVVETDSDTPRYQPKHASKRRK